MMRCDTCKWFVKRQSFDHIGDCRRRSPVVQLEMIVPGGYRSSDEPAGEWPRVKGSAFCGDYEAKE
jgi:hypothetical protein